VIVISYTGNPDAALKTLKRRMQQELRFSKMRENRCYESPSEKARRKSAEACKRRSKNRIRRYQEIS
jgi:small subunit ribosomal protein S21